MATKVRTVVDVDVRLRGEDYLGIERLKAMNVLAEIEDGILYLKNGSGEIQLEIEVEDLEMMMTVLTIAKKASLPPRPIPPRNLNEKDPSFFAD